MGQKFDFLILLDQYSRCMQARPSDAESFYCPIRAYSVVAATGADGEATEGGPFLGSKNQKFLPLPESPSTAKTVASMLITVVKSTTCEVSKMVSNMS